MSALKSLVSLRQEIYNGTRVNLLPHFSGGLASTNDGGSSGVVQNFLDDGVRGAFGGEYSLLKGRVRINSKYLVSMAVVPIDRWGLTATYSRICTKFFGQLLDCSKIGSSDFPTYAGEKEYVRSTQVRGT